MAQARRRKADPFGYGTPGEIFRARMGQAASIATSFQQGALNPLRRAFGMTSIPPGDIWGGQTGDWRRYLGQAQQAVQPYGFGYGPTWGQPGGFLGGSGTGTGAGAYATSGYGAATAGQLAQMYPGEAFMPTEMAKTSRDVAIGISEGKWPSKIGTRIVERMFGMSPDEARQWLQQSGYVEFAPESWKDVGAGRPELDYGVGGAGAGGGGSYGYTPRYYPSGGSGVRGQAAARGLGLVSWRIG